MKKLTYKAYEVQESENNNYKGNVVEKNIDTLPDGDILIKVKYSSLNYKDALSSIGNKGVTKHYPHIPGIDAAGFIESSHDKNFKKGDKVIVTGYDLGMNTSGGFGEYISVPKEWVVKCPSNLSLKEAMIYGTAGFTAALSVSKLIKNDNKPTDGEILVTGATGGVGSVAVSILSKLGYNVIASTGKATKKEFLVSIGAKDIILRKDLQETSKRPMLKSKWAGIIDTVGGLSLSNGLKALKYDGCATCCGNVAGHTFESSIYPFILRGITLYGIDSVECPMNKRITIWDNLANEWFVADTIKFKEVTLENLQNQIDLMLAGKHTGRTIISHLN